jgi:hypothetical protein
MNLFDICRESPEEILATLDPISQFFCDWFCNDKYTPMAQVIVALTWGILLAPWSSGLIFLVISIIFYEFFYYLFTRGRPPYYNLFVRTGCIMASILGYIIGRTLSQDDILMTGMD